MRGGAICSAALVFVIFSAMTLAQQNSIKLYNEPEMRHFRVPETWEKYKDKLTWGRGQTLAILDDGCDLMVPEWRAKLPWGEPKVVAGYDAVDHDDDPSPVPPGYHGTTVGFPSSLNHDNTLGVAYNNQVAHVRAVTIVHLTQDESRSIADGLQWVIDNHNRYNITTINLAALDDQQHQAPMQTAIDAKLDELRKLNIWVSAPCGNNQHVNGISWPACQPGVFGIGAVKPGEEVAINDRWKNTSILVPATATSSSNAYIAASSMILREAIEKSGYDWKQDGATLPEAMMAIFKKTGVDVDDTAGSGFRFKRMDLLSAVDYVFNSAMSARD